MPRTKLLSKNSIYQTYCQPNQCQLNWINLSSQIEKEEKKDFLLDKFIDKYINKSINNHLGLEPSDITIKHNLGDKHNWVNLGAMSKRQ